MPKLRCPWQIDVLTSKDVEKIVCWRYAPPYEIYNPTDTERDIFLNPVHQYYAVRYPSSRLVGYCCYGTEGRVPGGDYLEDGKRTLDVGVAMHPELVGEGLGKHFVSAILAFGELRYQPERFRVTIAQFNLRSLKTFETLGFEQVHQFERKFDALPFVQLIRPVELSP